MNYKNYIAFVLVCLCAFPNCELSANERVDYIVVGVGTAGATIAKLLSDDKITSVLALHSGKNLTQNPDIKLTENVLFTVSSSQLGSSFFQSGFSIPQPNADDRELFWTMGRPEGGTSSTNAGAWDRGTDQVYSQWEAIAGPEWSTATILNIYKSLEKYTGLTTNPLARGFNGPLDVRQNPEPTALAIKFAQAISLATGVPIVIDYNDLLTPISAATQMQYTQSGSQGQFRASSATAFLNEEVMTPHGKGVDGRKLRVKFKSTALKTIWKGNKAVGVKYFHDGEVKKAYANKGVIVCAGLYSSAFLMHSGVGPEDVLAPLDIKVKYNNPNVGLALADQVLFLIAFATNPDDTPISSDNLCTGQKFPSKVSVDILDPSSFFSVPLSNSKKQQVLSAIFCNGFAFPGNSVFGQIAHLPAPSGDPTVRKVRLTTMNPVPGIAFGLFDLIQPESRGRVTLKSANPFKPPVIDNGIFTNPADLELYVQAFQIYLKNIIDTLHAMDANYELLFPPRELLDDPILLTAFIKEGAASNQCWQSHCRMAPLNQGGVVDSIGKVYGVENLYVADVSITPVAMDGTPMASAYLIAANIARLLMQ